MALHNQFSIAGAQREAFPDAASEPRQLFCCREGSKLCPSFPAVLPLGKPKSRWLIYVSVVWFPYPISPLIFSASLPCVHILPPTPAGECSAWNQHRGILGLFTSSAQLGENCQRSQQLLPGGSKPNLKTFWQICLEDVFRGMLCAWQAAPSTRWGGTTGLFKGIAKARKCSSTVCVPASDLALHQCLCKS